MALNAHGFDSHTNRVEFVRKVKERFNDFLETLTYKNNYLRDIEDSLKNIKNHKHLIPENEKEGYQFRFNNIKKNLQKIDTMLLYIYLEVKYAGVTINILNDYWNPEDLHKLDMLRNGFEEINRLEVTDEILAMGKDIGERRSNPQLVPYLLNKRNEDLENGITDFLRYDTLEELCDYLSKKQDKANQSLINTSSFFSPTNLKLEKNNFQYFKKDNGSNDEDEEQVGGVTIVPYGTSRYKQREEQNTSKHFCSII